MKINKTKMIAFYGILVSLALIMSYVESQIPAFFALPGMKLGLTNIVVLTALYCMGAGSAMIINIVRILLVSLLFGNTVSFAFSIAGGMLSCVIMIILKKTGKFSIITVSIVGGIMHNVGQILVAIAMLQTTSLAWYLLVLWFSGLGAGAVVGIIGGMLCKNLKRFYDREIGRV